LRGSPAKDAPGHEPRSAPFYTRPFIPAGMTESAKVPHADTPKSNPFTQRLIEP